MTQNLFYDLPNDLKEEIQTRAYKMVHKEFLEDFNINAKHYYNELKRRCVAKRFNELKSRLDVLLDIPLIEHEDFHEFSNLCDKFKQLLDTHTYMLDDGGFHTILDEDDTYMFVGDGTVIHKTCINSYTLQNTLFADIDCGYVRYMKFDRLCNRYYDKLENPMEIPIYNEAEEEASYYEDYYSYTNYTEEDYFYDNY